MVFFTIFKGTTNILNAVLVPLILYVYMSIEQGKAAYIMLSALLLICLIFFKQQIIFVFFYIIVSRLLILFAKHKVHAVKKVVILTMISFICLNIAIKLTDYIFMSNIERILIRLTQNNYAIYLSIIFIEGLIVATGLVLTTYFFDKRLKHISFEVKN